MKYFSSEKSTALVTVPFILISIVFHCSSFQSKKSVAEVYYDCMESFKDDVKCKEFAKKTGEPAAARPESVNTIASETRYSPEQLASFKIRSELKDKAQGKSKPWVISYLGEPDERAYDGQQDYFVYKRPVSIYSREHDPDIEIRIVFRRGMVIQVLHTPPPTSR